MPPIAAHFARALGLHQAGRLAEAAALYREILAAYPNHAESLHHLGVIAHQTGQAREAIALMRQSLARAEPVAACHLNLAEALRLAGQPEAALIHTTRAMGLEPALASAHFGHGVTLLSLKRWSDALAAFDNALRLQPHYPMAWLNRGNSLKELNRRDEARASYDQAIAQDPHYAEAYNNRGLIDPDPRGALHDFEQALALNPNLAVLHYNRANLLREIGRVEDALESYDRAIALRPGYADAHSNRALTRLRQGDFVRAWDDFEWRWQSTQLIGRQPGFAQPTWRGEPFPGRTLLLHAEGGFGDTIHFARYAALAAQRGGRVILGIQRPLARLFQGFAGEVQILAEGEPLPAIDLQCPMMSLPGLFQTTLDTIPGTAPYLFAPPEAVAAWAPRLAGLSGRRVGLVWSGDPANIAYDDRRSIPLAQFEGLAELSGISFVSLQLGAPARELDRRGRRLILQDWTGEITDFADTAGLIAGLDLVVAVDTAVAHLAGALGKPVWLLNRFLPDWRWLQQGDDSPWYPRLRQFRQSKAGDWASVLVQLRDALALYAAGDEVVLQPVSQRIRAPA